MTIKNQDNSHIFDKPKGVQVISVYKNEASGNYFFAKPCKTARNRVEIKNASIDKDGNVVVSV
ncbi:MAG TPA: hypothetical protein EYN67_07540 [Flavobacteriales bacterium]|nr:hypothetical protein [Flavobacteriales bacterium]